jgi:hypothetical protein
MIVYENNYAIVDGYKFNKDKQTGYYLSTNKINGRRQRLHRYIYEKYYGKIPKGYDVHHIDHNKDNNEISNLKLVTAKEHQEIHARELTEEQRNKMRENMNLKARPKAIEWHKSKEGREWHKKQYEVSLANREPVEFICLNCGKKFMHVRNANNKFCGNNCKSAYRRKLGVDNIERECIICGNKFTINKYHKRKTCDNCKRKKH